MKKGHISAQKQVREIQNRFFATAKPAASDWVWAGWEWRVAKKVPLSRETILCLDKVKK